MRLDYWALGCLLRQARLDAGYTIPVLTKLSGVSEDCIRVYECGMRHGTATLKKFVAVCDALGVDPAVLIKGAEVSYDV